MSEPQIYDALAAAVAWRQPAQVAGPRGTVSCDGRVFPADWQLGQADQRAVVESRSSALRVRIAISWLRPTELAKS